MSLLLNWRVWALVALLVLIPTTYLKGRNDGRKLERLEYAGVVAQATSEAARLERARQSRADDAGRLHSAREAGLRADAARAGDAMRGLRDAVSSRETLRQSCAAQAERTDAYGRLFLESSEALEQLAATCDRHVNDLRMLIEAWPTDKP